VNDNKSIQKDEIISAKYLDPYLQKLGDRERRLLACDYAERVLPLFEAQYPSDDRPRQAIEVARRFANGQATEEEMLEARDAAWLANEMAYFDQPADHPVSWYGAWPPAGAAGAAALTADERIDFNAIRQYSVNSMEQAHHSGKQEEQWHRERLAFYLLS
jgi:hypothetical protein